MDSYPEGLDLSVLFVLSFLFSTSLLLMTEVISLEMSPWSCPSQALCVLPECCRMAWPPWIVLMAHKQLEKQ